MTKKKSVAFFERSSWYHRYKIVNDDGTIKYAKKGGFSTQEEAEESYKKYLEEYQNKIRNYQITVDKNVNFSDYLKYWFENIYSLRVEDTTKIVVNTGKVNVSANVEETTLKTYSMGVEQTYGTFENGGTAEVDAQI